VLSALVISTVSPLPGTGPDPLFQFPAVAQLPLPAVHVSVAPCTRCAKIAPAAEAAKNKQRIRRRAPPFFTTIFHFSC
jgi:hypothetical protein